MGSGSEKSGKKQILDLDDPLEDPHRDADQALDEVMKESGIIPTPTVKPPPGAPPMRERQMTLVDDEITEQARLASVLIDSMPPQRSDDDDLKAVRARLAPLERIPALARPITELGDALTDPKTAFVAGFVDSILPLETIIEVTGLPEIETLQILDRLIAQGAIVFPPRR